MIEPSNSSSVDRSPILADLQRELAGLRAEREEAQAREAAIAEILQTINDSPGDLAPVFDAILGKAHKLCGITFGSLQLCENGKFRAVAVRGMADSLAALLREPVEPVPGTPVWRLAGGERFVQIDDVGEEAKNHPEHRRANASAAHGLHTVLFVPLRQGSDLLGYITGYREEVRPFSDEEIALIENFAAQAVIAMENARLLIETRERARELQESLEYQTATSNVLKVISRSTFDLQPVFETIVETAARLCDANFANITHREGEAYRMVATFGYSPELETVSRGRLMPVDRGNLTGRTVLEGRVVHVADLFSDPEYTLAAEVARETSNKISLGEYRTGLGVPLLREGSVVGTLNLARSRVQPFTERQIDLVRTFADQAVIAIENTRLITETRQALEQQTATAEVLGVINASLGDLTPVFDAMLERATRLCEAPRGQLATYDGRLFRFVAAHGDTAYVEHLLARGPMPPEAGTSWPLIARGERVVHMPDVMESELYRSGHESTHRFVHAGGGRSLLTVALHQDERLLGALTIYRHEVKPFSDRQIALLQNFAAQAVIAMENARLLTETREALEQQTATAEVLQVINSSPGDLIPVFDAMLGKAMRLCEANFGFLSTYDGEHFNAVALHGLPQTYVAEYLSGPYLPGPGTTHDRLVKGEPAVHVPNLAIDQAESPRRRAVVEVLGVRSILAVPLRKDGVLVGGIHVFRQEVRPFTDKQIALLQNFAAQAVIAMENARLLIETREALEQQTATAEVLSVINASPGDLAPVFDAMLEKAMRLCEANFGILRTFDGQLLHAAASRGVPDAFAEFLAHNPQNIATIAPGTIAARMVEGEPVVHVVDLMGEKEYRSGNPHRRALVDLGGARSSLSVALIRDRTVLGSIQIYRQQMLAFTDKQIALLQNFAAQAVIAMENARLLGQLRESLEQQTATAEVLQVINSSPGDLAPVFQAILERAHTICGAELGSLVVHDGKHFRAVVTHGYPSEYAALVSQPFGGEAGSTYGRLVHGERFIHIPDLAAVTAPGLENPIRRAALDIAGIRTVLLVPLRKEDAFLGYISAQRREVRPFAGNEIALIENFAAQAVIAMENAKLLGELRQRTEEVAELNRGLEARVTEQVEELGRIGRLKRFLAPQLAELIVSQGDEKILESHRREIVVVFCDLRGYTAFTETAEPEEVLDFLREYHGALGPLVSQFEGTLDQFSGDGIMVFFNDPVPIPDPAARAVNMAVAMREAAGALIVDWRERGRDLGFGVGIAQGYATLGQIGFSERSGYTAIGTVCNVAARLCAEAKDGQILLSQRVNVALKGSLATEQVGALALKGLTQPVVAYNVPPTAAPPALRVIEGGPQQNV